MENDETISTDEIGRISKKWGGLAREMLTDADNFGISFPVDLDVRLKAVLLGALFLIVSILFIQLKILRKCTIIFHIAGFHVL